LEGIRSDGGPPGALPARLLGRARVFLDAIKFEHTLFALPFAYMGVVLADRSPAATDILWITVAMAGARTVAMGANRIIDRYQDAANPRTATRPIPAGRMSAREMTLFTAIAAAVFFGAAAQLNSLALALALPVLAVLVSYPYLKRYSWLCHFYLGFADGIAPAGGWVGVTGSLDWPPVLLLVAVAVWVAGFDLIYACQDVDFDRRTGVHSVPADFSIATALNLSSLLHVVMMACLVAVGFVESLGPLYWAGLVVVAGLAAYEHGLVRPDDLSRMNAAFFNMNSYIAITMLLATLAGVYV